MDAPERGGCGVHVAAFARKAMQGLRCEMETPFSLGMPRNAGALMPAHVAALLESDAGLEA